MFIARVVGNVWATRKHKSLEKTKLLLIQRVDGLTGQPLDEEIVLAVEPQNVETNAGVGDIVLVMDEGNSARQLLNDKYAPVRTIICGVIDIVYSKNKQQKWC
jgi:microcompartment protein CcmK/EutM